MRTVTLSVPHQYHAAVGEDDTSYDLSMYEYICIINGEEVGRWSYTAEGRISWSATSVGVGSYKIIWGEYTVAEDILDFSPSGVDVMCEDWRANSDAIEPPKDVISGSIVGDSVTSNPETSEG